MRGEGLCAHLPVEIPFADRLERERIQRHRRAVFLHGQQPAVMDQGVVLPVLGLTSRIDGSYVDRLR